MTLLKEGLLILLAVLLPAMGGMLLVRRFMPESFRRANHDAADPVWAIAGGAFGLLLGFMVVNLWQDLTEADDAVQAEANALINLWELSAGLPPEARAPVRERLREYTRLILEDEWEALGKHGQSVTAAAMMDQLWLTYIGLEASLGTENVSYAASMQRVPLLQDARNNRIDAAENSVPAVLWVVLVGGVAIVIALMWFAGAEDIRTQILMTVVLAVSLASILFLIRAFNNPFQGSVRADSSPFQSALKHFNN